MPSQKGIEKHLLTKMYHFYQSNCRQTSILNTFAQGHCYWFCIGKKTPYGSKISFTLRVVITCILLLQKICQKKCLHTETISCPHHLSIYPRARALLEACVWAAVFTQDIWSTFQGVLFEQAMCPAAQINAFPLTFPTNCSIPFHKSKAATWPINRVKKCLFS